MEVTGDVVMAWMLLWRAKIATKKLADKPKNKDVEFYEGQLKSAEYFIRTVLPVTHGKIVAVLDACSASLEISDTAFGGK
jgi:hypothetical protein